MIKLANYIFSRIPQVEIGVRISYWKSELIHKYMQKFKRTKVKGVDSSKESAEGSCNVEVSLCDIEKELIKHGVNKGDILIVHSSMQKLSCTGAKPSEVIDMLLRIVGDDGTLVMPAIPKYKEAASLASGIDRISVDLSEEIWTYDVKKTPPWTGAIPYKLMKTEGARRGRHPLNTVVAKGRHVDEMFARELKTPQSLPCGPDSPWAYCAKHNAKIVALGVDLAHSLTMIHVAEDCYESEWPVNNWYRNRKFLVVDKGEEQTVEVRERHPKWAMHYSERKLDHDLAKNKISFKSTVGNIAITSVGSEALLTFLNCRKSKGYPYYLWRSTQ